MNSISLKESIISHVVTIRTRVRDPVNVMAACARLQLPAPVHRTVRLYSAEATGLTVELSGWRYPVVCQSESGDVKYDNYGGSWGDPSQLVRFLRAYAVEKVKLEARKQGQTTVEQPLADGSIRVQIAVSG